MARRTFRTTDLSRKNAPREAAGGTSGCMPDRQFRQWHASFMPEASDSQARTAFEEVRRVVAPNARVPGPKLGDVLEGIRDLRDKVGVIEGVVRDGRTVPLRTTGVHPVDDCGAEGCYETLPDPRTSHLVERADIFGRTEDVVDWTPKNERCMPFPLDTSAEAEEDDQKDGPDGLVEPRKRGWLLEEALAIVTGDRGRFYGHPVDNHGCTADLWRAYLERRQQALGTSRVTVDARDVCWLNIMQKASRDANLRNVDNLRDAVGYAENAQEVEDERERRFRKMMDQELGAE